MFWISFLERCIYKFTRKQHSNSRRNYWAENMAGILIEICILLI